MPGAGSRELQLSRTYCVQAVEGQYPVARVVAAPDGWNRIPSAIDETNAEHPRKTPSARCGERRFQRSPIFMRPLVEDGRQIAHRNAFFDLSQSGVDQRD